MEFVSALVGNKRVVFIVLFVIFIFLVSFISWKAVYWRKKKKDAVKDFKSPILKTASYENKIRSNVNREIAVKSKDKKITGKT